MDCLHQPESETHTYQDLSNRKTADILSLSPGAELHCLPFFNLGYHFIFYVLFLAMQHVDEPFLTRDLAVRRFCPVVRNSDFLAHVAGWPSHLDKKDHNQIKSETQRFLSGYGQQHHRLALAIHYLT